MHWFPTFAVLSHRYPFHIKTTSDPISLVRRFQSIPARYRSRQSPALHPGRLQYLLRSGSFPRPKAQHGPQHRLECALHLFGHSLQVCCSPRFPNAMLKPPVRGPAQVTVVPRDTLLQVHYAHLRYFGPRRVGASLASSNFVPRAAAQSPILGVSGC